MMLRLLALASILLISAGDAGQESEPFELGSLDAAKQAADIVKTKLVNLAVKSGEEAMENLGVLDSLADFWNDQTEVDKLLDKVSGGLDELLSFSDGGVIDQWSDQLDLIVDEGTAYLDTLLDACETGDETAMRRALIQEQRQRANRTRSGKPQEAQGLVVATLGASLYYEKQVSNVKFSGGGGISLSLGSSFGQEFFTGVGVGLDVSLEYSAQSCDACSISQTCKDGKCEAITCGKPRYKCPAGTTCTSSGICEAWTCLSDAECVSPQKCDMPTGFRSGYCVGESSTTGWGKWFSGDFSFSVDFFLDTGSFSGFAWTVSIGGLGELLSPLPIDGVTVVLAHPHWGCLGQGHDAEWFDAIQFVGFGVNFNVNISAIRSKFKELKDGGIKNLFKKNSNLNNKVKQQKTKTDFWNGLNIGFGLAATLVDTEDVGQSVFGTVSCPWDAPASRDTGKVLSSEGGALDSLLGTLTPMLTQGEFGTTFCVGSCGVDGSPLSSDEALAGTVSLGPSESCDAFEAEVALHDVTVASVLYVTTASLDAGVKSVLETALSPFSGFGLQTPSLSLLASSSQLKLVLSGAPSLVGVADTEADGFLSVVSDLQDSIVVQLTADLKYSGDVTIEFRVGMLPQQVTENFAISNSDGTLGLSVYSGFSHVLNSGTGPVLQAGATLPLTICAQDCDSDTPYYLYLTGDLSLKVVSGAQLVEGLLTFDGTWYGALGLPFLHVSDIMLGASIDLRVALPTELKLGATVCLGSQTACIEKADPDMFVEARTYLGVSASVPAENYFMAMVTQLTIGGLVNIFSDYVPGLSSVSLSGKLAATGIYPYNPDSENCAGWDSSYESEPDALDSDCFATFSFSPVKTVVIPFKEQDVVIPVGIAVKGRLNILGWEIAVDLEVSKTKFKIDVEMDKVALKFGGFELMTIGKELKTVGGRKRATGGARFLLDLQLSPPKALVDIQGAFDIPMLRASGEIAIALNDEEFSFEAEIDFFDGALSAEATVRWDWDLTSFYMGLADMNFLDVVTVKEVSFEYDSSSATTTAVFKCRIRALDLVEVSSQIAFTETANGFDIDFDIKAGPTRAIGHASMDMSNFLNSEFDIDIEVDWDEIGDAIEEGINTAVNAIADTAEAAWNAVEEGVEKLWGEVEDLFEGALSGIKDLAESFLASMEDVLADLQDAIDKVPVLRDIVEAGKKLLSGDFEGAAQSVGSAVGVFTASNAQMVERTPARYDDYGCRIVRDEWEECWFGFCSDEHGPDYSDPDCLEEVALAAAEVEVKSSKMVKKRGVKDESQLHNKGLQAILDGTRIPAPTVNPAKVSVPFGTDKSNIKGDITGGIKTLGTEGTLGGAEKDFSVSQFFDLSSKEAFEASQQAAQGPMAAALADKVLEDQEGLTIKVQLEAGLITVDPPRFEQEELVPLELFCYESNNLPKPTLLTDHRCSEDKSVEVLSKLRFPGLGCGPEIFHVVWQGLDDPSCGLATIALQMLAVKPAPPYFKFKPGDVTISGTTSLTDWSVVGKAVGGTHPGCNPGFNLNYVDVLQPSSSPGSCEAKVIKRTWVLQPKFKNSACQGQEIISEFTTTHVQYITVEDKDAPRWTYKPAKTLYVPFLSSIGPVGIPIVEEYAHADFSSVAILGNLPFISLIGKTSAPTVTSSDGPLVYSSTEAADEATCRDTGIASFLRTWTSEDACGNTRTWKQTVIIQHPTNQPTFPLPNNLPFGMYYAADGVVQLENPCDPGKMVNGGVRKYHGGTVSCPAENWDGLGCRRISETVQYSEKVTAAMSFQSFPADLTQSTTKSLSPSETGTAVGSGYCGVEVSVQYSDASPRKKACGRWEIKRTWSLAPIFSFCTTGSAESVSRVQVITVTDTSAPIWSFKPPASLSIPFFSNSWPLTGIPMAVESGHQDAVDLGLTSGPVTLTSSDGTLNKYSTASTCASDGRARMTRTWVAKDQCGNSRTWVQTIKIENPRESIAVPPPLPAQWSLAPGIEQLTSNACNPRKRVIRGEKNYEPQNVHCPNILTDPNQCRMISSDSDTTTDLKPNKPSFSSFPADYTSPVPYMGPAFITPPITGIPQVAKFCGAPVTLEHSDSGLIDLSCGKKIKRTWKIRPVFPGCSQAPVAVSKVQNLFFKPGC